MSGVVALSLYRRGSKTSVAIRAVDFNNQYWTANRDDALLGYVSIQEPKSSNFSSVKTILIFFLISDESVTRNFPTVGVHSGFTPQYYAEYLKKKRLATFLLRRTPRLTEYFYHINHTKHNYAKPVFFC
jgi:hypothetical protein